MLHMGAPDCPAESSTGLRQYHSLQCSPVHGFGRLLCYPPKQRQKKSQQIEPGDKTKRTNKFRITDLPKAERAGRWGGTLGVPKLGELWLGMADGVVMTLVSLVAIQNVTTKNSKNNRQTIQNTKGTIQGSICSNSSRLWTRRCSLKQCLSSGPLLVSN